MIGKKSQEENPHQIHPAQNLTLSPRPLQNVPEATLNDDFYFIAKAFDNAGISVRHQKEHLKELKIGENRFEQLYSESRNLDNVLKWKQSMLHETEIGGLNV